MNDGEAGKGVNQRMRMEERGKGRGSWRKERPEEGDEGKEEGERKKI